jgi:DnaJ-class molecular chaperone
MSSPNGRNHYEVLEIREDARSEVIRGAIRTWRAIHHPDKNPEQREQAEEMSKQIADIEGVLCDPTKKAAYDRQLKARRWKMPPRRPREAASASFVLRWPTKTPFATAFDEGVLG